MNQVQLETSVTQLTATGGSAASRLEEHLEFEEAMMGVVTSAAQSLSGRQISVVDGSIRADLVLEFENRRRVAIDIKLSASVASLHRLLVSSQASGADILVITKNVSRTLKRSTKSLEGLSHGRRCFVAEPDLEVIRYLLRLMRGDVVRSPPNHRFFEIKQ